MYDSVYPSRTARFGVALVSSGVLKLKGLEHAEDLRSGASPRSPANQFAASKNKEVPARLLCTGRWTRSAAA
jgi:hypothetical protein